MTPKKEYLSKRFCKLSRHEHTIKSILDSNFSMLKGDYGKVTDEDFDKIKAKYNIDEYNKRILPIMDDEFTEEEILQLNEFFSTSPGKKLSSFTFINKLGNQIKEIMEDADRDLSKKQQEENDDKKKENYKKI